MAYIQFTVTKNLGTNATVTLSVQSISPGDTITFVTDTEGTLIQCNGGSPFLHPRAGDLYPVPMKGTNPEPLLVAKSCDNPKELDWKCGQQDGPDGTFQAWTAEVGPVFPPMGSD
jgi:hypothetical protein